MPTRDQLSVYHTNEMHQVIAGVVDRFVAGEKDPQVLNLRVMRVGNPNWRSGAHMLMQHVTVDSPGVQAWLLSKENAAMVLNQLRQRTDAQQTHDLNMVIHNGQTEKLVNIRGRNYVRSVRPSKTGWPPYEPETGEIQEGYKLSISPLLTTDGRIIDCVIEADIDQVDQTQSGRPGTATAQQRGASGADRCPSGRQLAFTRTIPLALRHGAAVVMWRGCEPGNASNPRFRS